MAFIQVTLLATVIVYCHKRRIKAHPDILSSFRARHPLRVIVFSTINRLRSNGTINVQNNQEWLSLQIYFLRIKRDILEK
ncbi:hypothetical protein Krac_9589 [Ktedonobacter racemifer DSM 44963]|uniref:Uncharacterized protein n=1 Tax=Ktedonobacter racemifer DSM 44963 TaxID=485913 RepID=D6TCR6_KTERA|nr:hypothetical protein Krac_9589 [Ktedonobacter racemifer DSM 44963]